MLVGIVEFAVSIGTRLEKEETSQNSLKDNNVGFYERAIHGARENINVA